MREIHRISGVVSVGFLCVLAVTGVLLNHQNRLDNPTSQTNEPHHISSLAHNPMSNTLYVGTQDGVYQSKDKSSFSKIKFPYPISKIQTIEIHKNNYKHIYVVSKEGVILKSKDGGLIWERIELPDSLEFITAFTLGSQLSEFIVSEKNAIHRTVDDGKTWHTVVSSSPKRSFRDLVWEIHTGQIFAPLLVYLYDLSAILLVFLSITGLFLFKTAAAPQIIKKVKRRVKKKKTT